MNMTFNLGY